MSMRVKLRDICKAVEYGYTASATTEPIGPKFLRITDIVPASLDWDGVPHCPIDADKLDKYRLTTGDIVIARTGATTGWAKYIKDPPEAVFASYLIRIRPHDDVDARFIGFIVESQIYKEFIQQHMGGAAQPNANAQVLTSYEFDLPDLPTQRRIAGILSAYDELISNNQRRIAILEEMARALYREWFVYFRALGVVMNEGEELPEGWTLKPLPEVAHVTYGAPFDSKQFNTTGEGMPLIRIRDIPTGATETWTTQAAEQKYHVRDGEILVGMDGDFHMCMWSSGHAFQNQRVAKFTSRGAIGNYHLFLALEKPIQEFNRSIVGTTVAHLGASHIRSIAIAWPPSAILDRAKAILEPMADQLLVLKKQTANLRRTRDLLLPRLMSGRVEVELSEQ